VWQAGFIWDDDAVLTDNPCIVGPLGLKEIWTTSAADICPLVVTTFWLEHALWGLAPLPYHLVNVLLHGTCAILLWQILRSLRVRGAWLGAALWALHPVEVESVAWITEMKNTESGLFFLLSILFFVGWLREKELDRRSKNRWKYGLSLLFAALAMAAKSSTVILPVVLCLCAWWIEGRWYWRNVVKMVPIFLMAIAASALSIWTQSLQLATVTDPLWVRTWAERLATAGNAVWFYSSKLLWPHPLIAIYPRWHNNLGFFLLQQGHANEALEQFRKGLEIYPKYVEALTNVGLALVQKGELGGAIDEFQKALEINPGYSVAHYNLGNAFFQKGELDKAGQQYQIALKIAPNSFRAHVNLGLVLLQKGQLDEAIDQFQRALEMNSNYADVHSNLGVCLLRKGQLEEAISQFQEALRLDPGSSAVQNNLTTAQALMRQRGGH